MAKILFALVVVKVFGLRIWKVGHIKLTKSPIAHIRVCEKQKKNT